MVAGKESRNEYEKDIIMTGYTALCTTAYLAENYYMDLCDAIPEGILYRSQRFSFDESVAEICGEIKLYCKTGLCDGVYNIGKGGVFKALWDMAEDAGVGIRIYLNNIPIRQETVEICNVLDINPYMLDGKGSHLLLSLEGNYLVRELSAKGIQATVIGHTTADNDRTIINGDEIRYLTFRVTDELERLGKKDYTKKQ